MYALTEQKCESVNTKSLLSIGAVALTQLANKDNSKDLRQKFYRFMPFYCIVAIRVTNFLVVSYSIYS